MASTRAHAPMRSGRCRRMADEGENALHKRRDTPTAPTQYAIIIWNKRHNKTENKSANEQTVHITAIQYATTRGVI